MMMGLLPTNRFIVVEHRVVVVVVAAAALLSLLLHSAAVHGAIIPGGISTASDKISASLSSLSNFADAKLAHDDAAHAIRRRFPEPPASWESGGANRNSLSADFKQTHDDQANDQQQQDDENELSEQRVEIGETEGYRRAGDLFRSSINENVEPCTDFFEFACGKWNANNKMPDDQITYGHFPEAREKVNDEMKVLFDDRTPSSSRAINAAKQIYRACMDTERLNRERSVPLLRKLEAFGYWPVVHGDLWREDRFNLSALLVNVARSRSIDVFVDVYVSMDQKNVSRRMLHFDQGALALGASAQNYYLNAERYQPQLAAFRQYMIKKIQLVVDDAKTRVSRASIEHAVDEIFAFEKRLAQILVPDEQRRNFTRMFNVRKFSQMRNMIPDENWDAYFGWMTPTHLRAYIDADPDVIVTEPEFFVKLHRLLSSTERRVLANYVLWRYIATWAMQIDERFDELQQNFLKVFIGKNKRSPRWKDCIAMATSKMSYAASAMYVRRHSDHASKRVATEMIEDIHEAFRGMLQRNDWMDAGTREYALRKANEMISFIGYPEEMTFNDRVLDDFYANFTLANGDSFSDMMERASWWTQRKAFQRLCQPVDRNEFGASASTVNAFYSGVKNAITLPAAILQPPFFDENFPRAVNYGAIGAVIGHEITHGFDDQGSQFDKIGNLVDWWAPETKRRFIERKRCIIDQYSAFAVPETNDTMHINGLLTQGENIADNGGIKQAFRAYRERVRREGGQEEARIPGFARYTPNQVFFMSFAQVWCGTIRPEAAVRQLLTDPHSPNRFRVNGVLRNQPEFADAFKCRVGSPMNPDPERRCAVW